MTQVEIPDAARAEHGGYRVDVSRGERNGRVSSEWFSRPADERYLSLSELFAAVRGRAARSRTVESAAMRVEAGHGDADRLALVLPGENMPLVPNPLELWAARESCRRTGYLSAPAPSTACRNQPSVRADLPSVPSWSKRSRSAASPRVFSISCRASRQLPATSPTGMRGSIWRRGRRSCSIG